MGCGLACVRSLRSVGLLCLEGLMRACIQISGATWLYFWCSTSVGLRLTYPICEIYWNGQPVVQIVGAGFLDRSVHEQVLLLLELFLQEKKLQTAPGFCIFTRIWLAKPYKKKTGQAAVFRFLQASSFCMKTGVLIPVLYCQKWK